MNLEDLSITVRERTLGELFDLGLLLVRRHLRSIVILAGIGVLPCILVDGLIMLAFDDLSWHALSWLVVLLTAQAPLACAPISAFLGEAMFNARPTVREGLARFREQLGPLVGLSLLRGLVVGAGVLVFHSIGDGLVGLISLGVLLFYPAHVVEVILLERQGFRASLKRSNQLMSAWRSEAVTHLLVAGLAIVGGVIVGVIAAAEIANLLFWNLLDFEEWWLWFHPRAAFLTVILPWPIIIYLSAVRFLAYIDLRTRREGWEIELDLRRAGRRLDPQGVP